MKNIGNDPRSLFNGNHFSSFFVFLKQDATRRKRGYTIKWSVDGLIV